MVTVLARDLYNEMKAFVGLTGGNYHDWYVGLTPNNANGCLFVQHRVPEDGLWIFRECPSYAIARNIKDSLVKMGCDGTFYEGWDCRNLSVYAYLKTPITRP